MILLIPYILIALLAGLLAGWFIAKRKYEHKLSAQLEESARHTNALITELAAISQDKAILTSELGTSVTAHTSLKAKYDALYIKQIELTNEKNRLKDQQQRP